MMQTASKKNGVSPLATENEKISRPMYSLVYNNNILSNFVRIRAGNKYK
jgi:hypothetical protein